MTERFVVSLSPNCFDMKCASKNDVVLLGWLTSNWCCGGGDEDGETKNRTGWMAAARREVSSQGRDGRPVRVVLKRVSGCAAVLVLDDDLSALGWLIGVCGVQLLHLQTVQVHCKSGFPC